MVFYDPPEVCLCVCLGRKWRGWIEREREGRFEHLLTVMPFTIITAYICGPLQGRVGVLGWQLPPFPSIPFYFFSGKANVMDIIVLIDIQLLLLFL